MNRINYVVVALGNDVGPIFEHVVENTSDTLIVNSRITPDGLVIMHCNGNHRDSAALAKLGVVRILVGKR